MSQTKLSDGAKKARPLKLSAAKAWRTYLGGSMIDALHGVEGTEDTHFPEEWIMSVTAARNAGREHIQNEGMSVEENTGKFLKELIEECPEKMLGKAHFNKYGATTGVLIKLIDSSERLSIQVHPNKEMAKQWFHSDYGKTECWHILGGREIDGEKPCIYFGFKEGITKEYWKKVFDEQDIAKMLDCLHKIEVTPGDTWLIKGGVPHAIGAGCFLMEIQEPTDYTIRTERSTPSGFQIADSMCHQGIGFDNMFECFSYDGKTEEEIRKEFCISRNGNVLVGYDSTNCFQLESIDVNSELDVKPKEVFSGIYILEGNGSLESDGEFWKIKKGDQFFIPANTSYMLKSKEGLRAERYFGPAEYV